MRTIPDDEFWGTAQSRQQRQHFDEKVTGLYADDPEGSMDELYGRLDLLLRLRLDVARLNHCSNTAAIREYHDRLVSLMGDVYGEACLLATLRGVDPPPPVMAKFHERVEDLSRSFDRQKQCHPAYGGFVCYCDEQTLS